MRPLFLALLAAMCLTLTAHAESGGGNYSVIVNGKSHSINLDQDYTLTLDSGETISLRVELKAEQTFQTPDISFKHSSKLTAARSELDSGIYQVMTTSATGTLALVQVYTSVDPAFLTEMLLAELTKEEISYGYQMEREQISHTLQSGKELHGIKATMSYHSEVKYYEILVYSAKDQGVVVVTSIDQAFMLEEQDILDLFWGTFDIKF